MFSISQRVKAKQKGRCYLTVYTSIGHQDAVFTMRLPDTTLAWMYWEDVYGYMQQSTTKMWPCYSKLAGTLRWFRFLWSPVVSTMTTRWQLWLQAEECLGTKAGNYCYRGRSPFQIFRLWLGYEVSFLRGCVEVLALVWCSYWEVTELQRH
jgi:hypothetical protein